MRRFFTPFAIILLFSLIDVQQLTAQGSTPCQLFTWIQCGDQLIDSTKYGDSLYNNYNNVNNYPCIEDDTANLVNGFDKQYKITISGPTNVRFVLDILNNTDLDMFLLDTCAFIKRCYYTNEYNLANGISREVLDVYLTIPGTYSLIVDNKNWFGVGIYQLTVDCSCSCVEPPGDLPIGETIFCDDFENYIPNKALAPQSSRWELWDSLSVDALVTTTGFSGKGARLQTQGSSKPRVVYTLEKDEPPAGSGRFRLSWKMNVAPGKEARYNLLHRGPGTGFVNWGYHVRFKTNGQGEVRLGNPANAPIATFPYPQGIWINVVQINDMTKNVAELWINNNFVTSWQFSTGYTQAGVNFNLNRMNAIEFVAENNTDFRIDNICVWKKTGNCNGGGAPVCVENGANYPNIAAARCDLYTSAEWGGCNSVCDYGGTFIYRGDTYTGNLDGSDLAPELVRLDPCVISAYGGVVPAPLYADVYVFSKHDTDSINLDFVPANNLAKAKIFVFACNVKSPGGGCTNGQQCLQEVGNTGVYTPFTCDSFYYLVITGTINTAYSITVTPEGPCNSNFTPLNLDCNGVGNIVTLADQVAGTSVFDSTAATSPYRKCYGGARPYSGGEKIYKITLDRPSILKVAIKSKTAMGLFLSSYECGKGCLNYDETSVSDSIAVLTELLPEGNYFLIIDKATPAGPDDFILYATCEAKSFFPKSTTLATCVLGPFPKPSGLSIPAITGKKVSIVSESCGCAEADTLLPHTIHLPNGLYDFSAEDIISFYYRDSTQNLVSNELKYSFPYNPNTPTGMTFDLEKNNPEDTTKCYYYNGDSLAIWVAQTRPGSSNFREMLPEFTDPLPPLITATNIFEAEAHSQIKEVILSEAISFNPTTYVLRTRYTAEINTELSLQASKPWRLEILADSTNWINVTPNIGVTGGGVYPISVSLSANNSPIPRTAVLQFISNHRPDFFRFDVLVIQDGICIPAEVEIVPSISEFCEGESITLTADVGVNPADPNQSLASIYNYKWSDNSTSPSITLTPSTGQKTYSVTINNKDFNCPATDSAGITFTVGQRPALPNLVSPPEIRICSNDPAPVLAVSVPAGQIVNWFDMPAGGDTLLLNSPTYTPTPPVSGSYYAAAQYPGGCSSLTRRKISLTVDPAPDISISTKTCEPNFQFYTLTGSTNGNNVVTNQGLKTFANGLFNISHIPIGNPVTVTAFNDLCQNSLTETPPVCICSVSTPVSGGDKAVCDTETPLLTATVPGPNETVDWYNVPTGGMVLPQGQNTSTFSPTVAGPYFAEGRNTLNNCVSPVRTPVQLTIQPTPPLTLTDTTCSPNLSTYQLTVQTTSGVVLTASAGVVSGTNGQFTVSALQAGQNVNLTATDTTTNCSGSLLVLAPDCACLTILPPVSGGDAAICPGAPFPVLGVTVAPGFTADWFNANNVNVASDTLFFRPFLPGTYYVQTRNPDNGCTSAAKTAVSLSINPLPAITVAPAQCAPNRLTYSRVVMIGPGSVLSANPGAVSGNNGNFVVSNVPVNKPLSLTVTDNITGCSRDTLLDGVPCPCIQVVNPPDFPGNNPVEICSGAAIPLLQVSVGPNQSANWYDASNVLLATQTINYQPSGPGVFKVEAIDTISKCKSATPITVQVLVHPLPNVQVSAKACDNTLTTWQIAISTAPANQIIHNLGTLAGSNGVFTLSGIPAGLDAQLTVVNPQTSCSITQTIVSPVCSCDTSIAPPQTGDDQLVCSGQPLPNLTATVGPNQTVFWYNQFGVQIGQGFSLSPPGPGTYCAETRNLVDNCPSLSCTEVSIIIQPLPTLTMVDTICSDDLTTYSLQVKTNGTGIDVLPAYTYIMVAAGEYVILNIPVSTSVQITAEDANTGCLFTRNITVNNCPCPLLPAPFNPVNREICQGDVIPLLSVSVNNPATQTVDWFTAAGALILNGGIGTLSYKPPLAESATFFTQTRDLITQCISASRTPVTLTVRDSVRVNAGLDRMVCAGEQVALTVSLNGTDGGIWSANIPNGVFFPNNNVLSAQYYVPPPGASTVVLTLLSNDPPGPCPAASDQVQLTVHPLPIVQIDSVYCATNLKTWTINFNTDAILVNPDQGVLTALGNNHYQVSNIEKGKSLSVGVENAVGCTNIIEFPAPACACPDIAAPMLPAQVEVCANETIPVLNVVVGADETVDWYNAAVGGFLLASDTPSYQPVGQGEIYAQTRNRVNGCVSARVKVTIMVKPLPIANAGPPLSVCQGDPATLMAGGGTGYTYLWSTGQTTQNIVVVPLVTSIYYLTVTANNCQATDSVQVKINPVPQIAIIPISPVRCFGESNGAIESVVTGGTPGFSFLWSNNSVLQSINGLPAGLYTVTVTDDANCQSIAAFILTQPAPLVLSDTIILNANAGQADGSILVTVQGGNGKYRFDWYRNDSLLIGENNTVLDSMPAGFYSVLVTDTLGCMISSGILAIGTVGIDEQPGRDRVLIYPNPTSGLIYLYLSLHKYAPVEISVLDMLGRSVYFKRHGMLLQETLIMDISEQPAGLYLVQLRLGDSILVYKVNVSKK